VERSNRMCHAYCLLGNHYHLLVLNQVNSLKGRPMFKTGFDRGGE
jgi:hypothetical protein